MEIMKIETAKIRDILLLIITAMSILSLILSFSVVTMSFTRERKLSDTVLALRLYDIRPELEVTGMDYSVSTVPVPILDTPNIFFNEDNTLNRWEYFFMNDNLGLTATFRFVVVKIHIPIKVYEHFSNIKCTWEVEENSGTVLKTDFTLSDSSYYYFEATSDISRHMWKEEVPSRIDIEVFLYL